MPQLAHPRSIHERPVRCAEHNTGVYATVPRIGSGSHLIRAPALPRVLWDIDLVPARSADNTARAPRTQDIMGTVAGACPLPWSVTHRRARTRRAFSDRARTRDRHELGTPRHGRAGPRT
jgi:hypothetical protein